MITIDTIPTAPPNAVLLKNWLNELGMSAEDFAEKVGVTKPTIYDWCRGSSRPTKAMHQQKMHLLSGGRLQPVGWQTDEERAELDACAPLASTGTEG